jgi:MFS family permease
VGLLLALVIVSALKAGLTPEHFDGWGWRVPFLLSAPIVLVAAWIRLGMLESPVFARLQRAGETSKSPLADTVRSASSWRMILLAIFSAQGATSVLLYTSIVYMIYFLQNVLHVDALHADLCLALAIVVAAPFYPTFGALSDRIGRSRVMLLGTTTWLAVAYPVFAAIEAAASAAAWPKVTALISVLSVLTAMVMAPLPAYISECFPARTRTTGFGLAQQIGNIIFGGFLPLISLSLVRWSGNSLAGVAYSMASLVPCVLAMYLWGLKQDREFRVLREQGSLSAAS